MTGAAYQEGSEQSIMTEKINIEYVQETGFRERMEKVSETYLKKYRRRGRFTSYDGTRIPYF